MGRKSIETLVGAFVLAGILAVVFLAMKAANLASFSGGEGYRVTAQFDNIGGLKVRAPVKSAGVTVGRVVAIGFDNKTFMAVATLELQHGVKFPKDSAAKILTAGLLGEQYIGLEPGGAAEDLAANDRIRNTQSAMVLERLVGDLVNSKAAEAGTAKP